MSRYYTLPFDAMVKESHPPRELLIEGAEAGSLTGPELVEVIRTMPSNPVLVIVAVFFFLHDSGDQTRVLLLAKQALD